MSTTLIQDTEEGLERARQLPSINHRPAALNLDDAARTAQTKASVVCGNTGIHHVGVYAKDPAVSAEFYRDVLGMEIVGGSTSDHPIGATAFLSSRPDEESHEIALFANPAFVHVAFKVSSLAELREKYERVVEKGIPIRFTADHGCSFAIYFGDPDGNMIEVYWPTGDLSRRQPQMEPLDLSRLDEELVKESIQQSQAAGNPPRKASLTCHNAGIHHAGMHAKDPAASAEFYRDLLGMQIVGGSTSDHPIGATAFLSSRPNEEHHEVALFANADFAHLAFKVSSLDELRVMYARVVEKAIPIRFTADHGCSFAIYFADPDANMIEVYWPTGNMQITEPQLGPLDLSQPDEILFRNLAPAPARVVASDMRTNGTAAASRQNQVKYVPAGTGPVYWGPGDQVTFLITGKETGGAFFLAELSVPPGGGPPLHIHHREDESFHMLEGTLTIQVGGRTITASPGDFAYLPRGIAHCFRNNSDVTAKALVLATPAGLENFFAEAFDAASDPGAPPPLASEELIGRLLVAFPKYGLELVPLTAVPTGD